MRFDILIGLALLLSGCATPPPVDQDISQALAEATGSPGGTAALREVGEKLTFAPFVDGNSVALLLDGKATYAAMTEAIEGAHQRIDMESYQFDEVEGGRFADLLLAKRADGVAVNLLYDAWGSSETPSALFDRLRRGGVQVVEYNPLDPLAKGPLDLNQRDHRKLLVIDNAVAITGGVNISRDYDRPTHGGAAPDEDHLPWRDTDVRIVGPVAARFDRLFVESWQAQKGPALPSPLPAADARGDTPIQAIDGAPDDHRPLIYRTLVVAIALARRSIHLTTGFFVPPPDLAELLEQAARRGVDVEIVVPGESDSPLSIAAGRADYGALLEAGVQVFERQGAVLHAKTAVIDGIWSAVGSSNLDWRSVVFNNEVDAIILGPGFGADMESLFQRDRTASVRIDPVRWAHRPLGERLQEWQATVIGTLL